MNLLIPITFIIQLFIPPGEPKEKLKLIWNDEFEYNGQPDSSKWSYDLGNGFDGWGNHELQHYTRSAENVVVKNGKLLITAIKKDSSWTSARLKSAGRKTWTYGKFVFRAKLPKGKGTWPALWMLGENISTAGWPACGEIDVMEHVGKNPTVVQAAMHTPASHGDTVDKNSTLVPTFDTEFHNYEVLWTKEKIEFFVDGQSFYIYQPAVRDAKTWPFDNPFYLILNVAIGGGFGGEVDPSVTTATMEVDYVRVYALSEVKS
jgi:beta-glucanase (GH16 family)